MGKRDQGPKVILSYSWVFPKFILSYEVEISWGFPKLIYETNLKTS